MINPHMATRIFYKAENLKLKSSNSIRGMGLSKQSKEILTLGLGTSGAKIKLMIFFSFSLRNFAYKLYYKYEV